MRSISGGTGSTPDDAPIRPRLGATRATRSIRPIYPKAMPPALREIPGAEVEIEIRLYADGGSITTRRSVLDGPDGARMTVGIDAVVR